MSLSRWAKYVHNLNLFRIVLSWGIWTAFVGLAATAFSQAEAVATGVKVAKEIGVLPLHEAVLVLCALCVIALLYGLKFAYAMHQEQIKLHILTTEAMVKSTNSIDKCTESINGLVGELRGRPCMVDRNKL